LLFSSHAVRIVPIERRNNISLEEFDRDFATKSRPVIISGSIEHWPARHWSRQDLRQRCGSRKLVQACDNSVDVKALAKRGGSRRWWAGLEESDLSRKGMPQTVGELMDAQDIGSPMYLHDAPIDKICPELLIDKDVFAPKYFPEDITEQLPLHWLKEDAGHTCLPNADPTGNSHGFPSMFIAGANTESKLHIDAKYTRFYMVVLHGTKDWIMFNSSDIPHLDPEGRDSTMFPVNLGADGFKLAETPEKLPGVDMFTGTAHAGDIVFVPENWPHQVRNKGATFAMANNYVDRFNLKMHLKYIKWEATRSKQAALELKLYQSPGFPLVNRPGPGHQDEPFVEYWERQRHSILVLPGGEDHPGDFWEEWETTPEDPRLVHDPGMLEADACEDQHRQCRAMADRGQCIQRPWSMRKECPRSCGGCTSRLAITGAKSEL